MTCGSTADEELVLLVLVLVLLVLLVLLESLESLELLELLDFEELELALDAVEPLERAVSCTLLDGFTLDAGVNARSSPIEVNVDSSAWTIFVVASTVGLLETEELLLLLLPEEFDVPLELLERAVSGGFIVKMFLTVTIVRPDSQNGDFHKKLEALHCHAPWQGDSSTAPT